MKGYWMVLINSVGCELDRKFITANDELSAFAVISNFDWTLHDGDMIRIQADDWQD